ncbi:carbon-nitrogen hydrolase family protein [Prunus dulcis]|uniref:Carbon-nitrogen hydrolase family protein n=1 Tax=Prunus dulcis TaxID=3755 RepID=A0A4Y1QYE1_PRUDU|nr:carbon-nitrogen hydrolase family protein [Prunus dulcis]
MLTPNCGVKVKLIQSRSCHNQLEML